MNTPDRQQQMIDYVSGEMSAEEQAEFRATLNGDIESQRQLEAMTRAVHALEDASDNDPTASLEAEVMRAVRKEVTQAGQPVRHAPQRWRVWGPIAVAAAVVMLVLMIADTGGPNGGGGGSVVWADVVNAMNRVDHFHAVAWADEPRNASMPKMYKVEMYYRSPGKYRAHGFEHVQFHDGKDSRIYSAAERKWLETEQARYRLIPDEYIKTFQQKGMLDALLHMMFQGNPPEGLPVKSATVAASAGIEVFDFAHDATTQWARIWVLKESQLPIRMKLYQPHYEDFMMVTFDYTDPQPESFFDPDHFEKVVKERNLRQVRQIMRAGAEKLEGKPVGLEQLYDPELGIQMPELVSIESADTGDLLIAAMHARNLKPDGRAYAPSYTEQLFDNWGNTYFRIAPRMYRYDDPDEFTDKPIRMTYMAVPPFVRGDGERVIKLRYSVYERAADSGMMTDVLIGEQEVAVPEPAGAGIPGNWPGRQLLKDPVKRRQALYPYHTLRSPLWVQLESVGSFEPLPTDGYQVLRHFRLWDEYAAVFERDSLDAVLADPFSDWSKMDQLGYYLLHLCRSGRTGEFDSLYQQLKPREDKFLAEDEQKNSLVSSYKKYHIKLAVAMALPRAIQALDEGHGPKVLDVSRSNDGHTVVVIQTPPNRSYDVSRNWRWGTPVDMRAWNRVAIAHEEGGRQKPTVRTFLLQGDADQLQFDYSVVIVDVLDDLKEHQSHNTDRFDWQLDIDLPEPGFATRAELIERYPGLAKSLENVDTPFEKLRKIIGQHEAAGRYDEAIEATRQQLALPQEDWHEYYRKDDEAYRNGRENLELNIAKYQAKLGQFDEALNSIDRIAANTKQPDYAGSPHDGRWRFLLETYTHVVQDLIEHEQYDRAQALLEQLESQRPDWRMYLDERVAVKVDGGVYGFTPSHKVWRTWKPVDIAWLRLEQARTGQVLPEQFGPD